MTTSPSRAKSPTMLLIAASWLRHTGHQVVQNCSSTTCPLSESFVKVSPPSVWAVNCGAVSRAVARVSAERIIKKNNVCGLRIARLPTCCPSPAPPIWAPRCLSVYTRPPSSHRLDTAAPSPSPDYLARRSSLLVGNLRPLPVKPELPMCPPIGPRLGLTNNLILARLLAYGEPREHSGVEDRSAGANELATNKFPLARTKRECY